MKKIISLLLISTLAFGQVKIKDLPTTTTGIGGDFLLKDDAAGISGSTKKISITNFLSTYVPSVFVSGTANYVPKFTSATTIANSQIFDNGTSVAIGNSSPTASTAFEVNSTAGGFVFPRMSTAQQGALTPFDGMSVFNNQTFTYDGYSAGSWYNFCGTNTTNTATYYPKFVTSTTISNGLLFDSTSTWTVAKNLRIDGLKIPTGAGAAKVLTSDASGVASWAAAATSGWSLTGNSGTSAGTNFIGTTDKQPLVFKINGVQCGRIDKQGIIAVDTLPASIYMGCKSGAAITTGSGNAIFGYLGAEYMTSGYNNTAIGDEALRYCVDCSTNTALGHEALLKTTSGSTNTGVAYQALYNNTTGSNNFGMGYQSLFTNTTGSYNMAWGFQSMYTANAVNGHNIGIGYRSLHKTTASSGNNIGIGYETLFSSTSGTFNIAIGTNNSYSMTSGSYNTGVGYNSLYSITTGLYNSAFGMQSLGFATTGSNNTSIGRRSLAFMTTGSGCTALGDSAGTINLTGTLNTFIGKNADCIGTALTNATAIGANAKVSSSNTVMIGSSANVTVSNSGGALATTATSGFFYIPSCAGIPTGVPSYLPTGGLPMIYDSSNLHLYIYVGGSWTIVN